MYRIAGIDLHKMFAVVLSDVAVEGDHRFQRWKFGTSFSQLRELCQWLVQQQA